MFSCRYYLLAGTLLGAASWWINYKVSNQIVIAENALATKDLAFLTHIDNGKLSQIKQLVLQGKDPKPLQLPMLDPSILELMDSSSNIKIDQFFVSFSGDVVNRASIDVLAYGQFDIKEMSRILETDYTITVMPGNQLQLVKKQETAEGFVCEVDQEVASEQRDVFYLQLNQNWLAASTDEKQPQRLLSRVEQKDKAEIDLTGWRDFRKGNLITLAVLQTEIAAEVPDGLVGMASNSLAKKNQQLKQIFAGASVALPEMRLQLNGLLKAEEQWVAEKSAALNEAIQGIASDSEQYSKTLADIVQRFKVSSQAEDLNISLQLDREIVNQFSDVFRETFTSIFRFDPKDVSSGVADASDQNITEKLDDDLWDYSVNTAMNGLPVYSSSFYQPDARKGAIAAQIKTISIDTELQLIQLELEAILKKPDDITRIIPGLTAGMEVTSVKDKSGNELLRDERCIEMVSLFQDKNQKRTIAKNHYGNIIVVSKEIRLVESASPEDIDQVTFTVDYAYPDKVSDHILPARKSESIEYAGTKLFISESEPGKLGYEVSGLVDNFLEIRPLNKNNEAIDLSFKTGLKTDGFSSVSQTVEGVAENYQVFFADDFYRVKETLSTSISAFNNSSLVVSRGKVDIAPYQIINKNLWLERLPEQSLKAQFDSSNNQFDMGGDLIHREDFKSVALHVARYDSFRTQNYSLQLLLPESSALVNNINAVELELEGGQSGASSSAFVLPSWATRYKNGDKQSISYRPYTEQLLLELEKDQVLKQLKGKATVRLPSQLKSEKLAFPKLKTKPEPGSIISLLSISRSVANTTNFRNYKINYSGSLEKLVQLYVLDESGERIVADKMTIEEGYVEFTFVLEQPGAAIELVMAKKQDLVIYPFTIKFDQQKLAKK